MEREGRKWLRSQMVCSRFMSAAHERCWTCSPFQAMVMTTWAAGRLSESVDTEVDREVERDAGR